MIVKTNLKLIIFIPILLLIYLSLAVFNNTYAQACAGGNWSELYFCSGNGTTSWGVAWTYYPSGGSPYSRTTYTSTSISGGSSCPSGATMYNYEGIPSLTTSYKMTTNDSIIWNTACVDPAVALTPNVFNACRMGEGVFYTDTLDVTCKNGQGGIYVACNGAQNNLGTIAPTAICPGIRTPPICAKGGNITLCDQFVQVGCNGCNYVEASGCDYSHPYPNWCVFRTLTNDSRCNSQPGCGPVPTTTTTTTTTTPPGACTAGTGSTNASCGGHAYYQCTGSSNNCEDFTYRCSGNSCVAAPHNPGQAQNLCCTGGNTCNNGSCTGTITCQQCSGSTCQSYSYSGSSCPTNCGAGCGVSCMAPNIKLNAKKG